MKNPNQYLKISSIAIIAIAVFAGVFYLFSHRNQINTNTNTATTATQQVTSTLPTATTLPEKFHYTITCPTGTSGYERYGSYDCSDSTDGMWQGQVDVTSTSARDVQEVVKTNNTKLTIKDAAYMSVVRKTVVDGEPAIIVKQTNGSEAGPSSPNLAQTLLVIHNGYLYLVHTREYQKDVETFFSSFHFTK